MLLLCRKAYCVVHCPPAGRKTNETHCIILPVVLYGCETLSLTLKKEHRLRVFKNKVLRKIFGAKKD